MLSVFGCNIGTEDVRKYCEATFFRFFFPITASWIGGVTRASSGRELDQTKADCPVLDAEQLNYVGVRTSAGIPAEYTPPPIEDLTARMEAFFVRKSTRQTRDEANDGSGCLILQGETWSIPGRAAAGVLHTCHLLSAFDFPLNVFELRRGAS